MSLPNAGKVNMKSPQSEAALPAGKFKPAASYGGNVSTGKIVGPLKKNPAPAAARKPDKAGTKITTVIQTATPESKARK